MHHMMTVQYFFCINELINAVCAIDCVHSSGQAQHIHIIGQNTKEIAFHSVTDRVPQFIFDSEFGINN